MLAEKLVSSSYWEWRNKKWAVRSSDIFSVKRKRVKCKNEKEEDNKKWRLTCKSPLRWGAVREWEGEKNCSSIAVALPQDDDDDEVLRHNTWQSWSKRRPASVNERGRKVEKEQRWRWTHRKIRFHSSENKKKTNRISIWNSVGHEPFWTM